MKEIKAILPFLVMGLLISCGMYACKTGQLIQAKPLGDVRYVPLNINNYIHDTIPAKSTAQLRTKQQLDSLFKYNFDTYYSKQFQAISEANSELVDIIKGMRSNGLIRQHKLDSTQYVNGQITKLLYDLKISNARLETKVDANEVKDELFRKNAISNDTWSRAMDNVAFYGLTAFVISVIINVFVSYYSTKRAIRKANKHV